LARRFVNPAFSFTMGWNYWYNWTVILPAELSASAVLVGFWTQDISPAVWISICMVVVIVINMLGAGRRQLIWRFHLMSHIYEQVHMVKPSLFSRALQLFLSVHGRIDPDQ
jgi:hypothetical protein